MARKIQSIRISEARQLHEDWYRKRGKAENTIQTVRSCLSAFERVVGNKVVRNITTDDVDRYFFARQEDGLQQSTLNVHTVRLNQFFKWCERKAYLDPMVMPMDGREQVKVPARPRARVAQEDFAALLDAAPNPRDRIVIALGLYTFMRASEIRGLRVGDLNLADSEPYLQAYRVKIKKNSTIGVSAELKQELGNYLAWYSTFIDKALQPEWYLAPGNKRRVARYSYETQRFEPLPTHEMVLTPEREMWENGYAVIVQRALKAIGWVVEPGEGVHTLRRSGARELFDQLREEKNFDDALLTVMALLGHARTDTTLVYLGVDREETRARKVIAGNVMFKRAAMQRGANVTPLRIVSAVE